MGAKKKYKYVFTKSEKKKKNHTTFYQAQTVAQHHPHYLHFGSPRAHFGNFSATIAGPRVHLLVPRTNFSDHRR